MLVDCVKPLAPFAYLYPDKRGERNDPWRNAAGVCYKLQQRVKRVLLCHVSKLSPAQAE